MKTYIAEKKCRGKVNFNEGDEVKMTDADAKPYLEDKAIREPESEQQPETETEAKPQREAKKVSASAAVEK